MNYNNSTFSNFKIILTIKILLLIIIFNQSAFSKPIPPGSGEGDVPANILFLLDNSQSMRKTITDGVGIENARDVVELDSGDLILAQGRRKGLLRITWSTKKLDTTFADADGTGGNAPSIRFRGLPSDTNCNTTANNSVLVGNVNSLGISNKGNSNNDDDIIWASDKMGRKVVAIDVNGLCEEVIPLTYQPLALTVRRLGTAGNYKDHLIVVGPGNIYSRNLTDGGLNTACATSGNLGSAIRRATGIALDGADDGTPKYLYIASSGHIYRFTLTGSNSTTYCPSTAVTNSYAHNNTGTNRHRYASAIEIDTDSDAVIYVTSNRKHRIQKLSIGSGNNSLTLDAERGTRRREATTSNFPIYTLSPRGLYVGSINKSDIGNKALLYVGDRKPSVQTFNKDASDLTWDSTLGGSKTTRLAGAKAAIAAVVDDSSLRSGANFGYGHWSAGTAAINKYDAHNGRGGTPDYYTGWEGDATGKSIPCTRNACIRVGIHREGYSDIPSALAATSLVFGTDARAFAQLASDYFNEPVASPYDDKSSCQLNYVIVIGDGRFWNETPPRGNAEDMIQNLRTSLGVKTLMVAYGGGITTLGMDKFDAMAIKGSCDVAGAADCEETIIADTPQELKTSLKSKIQQIIAQRLSFTAPSITATIEEGGALYQAQFNYEQREEWQGTILRKEIQGDGTVIHEADHAGNWNAAEEVKNQIKRYIWTTLPSESYIGNWDNWNEDNAESIANLFTKTGHEVLDYHRENAATNGSTLSTRCFGKSGTVVIEDEIDDDIKGLINFVRGEDYFGYKSCNIGEERDHVLGDLYHSQIISVSEPKANTDFTDTNQEAYWRNINGYSGFASSHASREEVIYAGGNDGMLHAFDAKTGEELWGFVPPFIASQMPTIMNINLNQSDGGGSNAIFGVDGSPVIHDMYIQALDSNGIKEGSKQWHTIMMLPYGRGGAGFSILDITNPRIQASVNDDGTGGKGPLHLFSVFNDTINHRVHYADKDGNIESLEYVGQYYSLDDSEEAARARENESDALGVTADVDAIRSCQTISDFMNSGTNSCYTGTTWSFELPIRGDALEPSDFEIFEDIDGVQTKINFTFSASGATSKFTFQSAKTFTASQSELSEADNSSINIQITNTKKTGVVDEPDYDYSKLGETWSTPRIIRLPKGGRGDADINDDPYVAIMGGGMGTAFNKVGSNIFIINFEDDEITDEIYDPGKIEKIIEIEDTDESNLSNSVPASPVVITPDLTVGIPWRGALVYTGDLEGKITKINLTNMLDDGMNPTANQVELYDSTTIFNLGSSMANGRYMYHSMDAAIGRDTHKFWLFGGTGDYERINDTESDLMDNVLFGIKDDAYPFFRAVPWGTTGTTATKVPDLTVCSDTTGDDDGALCPTHNDVGWVIHLSDHKKVTAEPTIYRGNVYYPLYKPDPGEDRCVLGSAFVCGVDDECGTNISKELQGSGSVPVGEQCYFVGRGILSELVVFGETLYANIAGPSDTRDTLVSVLAAPGEIDTYRNSWKQNY